MLPKQMLGKSNEDIQKAVLSAYKSQMKVISEYSGHVYDPDFPMPILKTKIPYHILRLYNQILNFHSPTISSKG